MKVSECEKCKNFAHCGWSSSYKPSGYHTVGVSHSYGYCKLYKERCLNIKKCEENK